MTFICTAIAGLMIFAGLLFFLGGTIGLVRFPDFYSRMHAAGKGDTLSSLLVLTGLGIYAFGHMMSDGHPLLAVIVLVKTLAISAFIMLTSPTSTHALMHAGYEDGIEPELGEGGENPMPHVTPISDEPEPAPEKAAAKKTTKKSPAAKKAPKKKTS